MMELLSLAWNLAEVRARLLKMGSRAADGHGADAGWTGFFEGFDIGGSYLVMVSWATNARLS